MDDFTSLIKWLVIFIIGCILCYYKLSKNENFINKKLSKTEISNNVDSFKIWILILLLIFGGLMNIFRLLFWLIKNIFPYKYVILVLESQVKTVN